MRHVPLSVKRSAARDHFVVGIAVTRFHPMNLFSFRVVIVHRLKPSWFMDSFADCHAPKVISWRSHSSNESSSSCCFLTCARQSITKGMFMLHLLALRLIYLEVLTPSRSFDAVAAHVESSCHLSSLTTWYSKKSHPAQEYRKRERLLMCFSPLIELCEA